MFIITSLIQTSNITYVYQSVSSSFPALVFEIHYLCTWVYIGVSSGIKPRCDGVKESCMSSL
jgi:hypothetical protein